MRYKWISISNAYVHPVPPRCHFFLQWLAGIAEKKGDDTGAVLKTFGSQVAIAPRYAQRRIIIFQGELSRKPPNALDISRARRFNFAETETCSPPVLNSFWPERNQFKGALIFRFVSPEEFISPSHLIRLLPIVLRRQPSNSVEKQRWIINKRFCIRNISIFFEQVQKVWGRNIFTEMFCFKNADANSAALSTSIHFYHHPPMVNDLKCAWLFCQNQEFTSMHNAIRA